jgi:hypothetical protein
MMLKRFATEIPKSLVFSTSMNQKKHQFGNKRIQVYGTL